MGVFDFLKKVDAEIACNRAVVREGGERVIVARMVGADMVLTEKGEAMAAARPAEKSSAKRKRTKPPAASEGLTDGNG